MTQPNPPVALGYLRQDISGDRELRDQDERAADYAVLPPGWPRAGR